jgi:hypothetical protein
VTLFPTKELASSMTFHEKYFTDCKSNKFHTTKKQFIIDLCNFLYTKLFYVGRDSVYYKVRKTVTQNSKWEIQPQLLTTDSKHSGTQELLLLITCGKKLSGM